MRNLRYLLLLFSCLANIIHKEWLGAFIISSSSSDVILRIDIICQVHPFWKHVSVAIIQHLDIWSSIMEIILLNLAFYGSISLSDPFQCFITKTSAWGYILINFYWTQSLVFNDNTPTSVLTLTSNFVQFSKITTM